MVVFIALIVGRIPAPEPLSSHHDRRARCVDPATWPDRPAAEHRFDLPAPGMGRRHFRATHLLPRPRGTIPPEPRGLDRAAGGPRRRPGSGHARGCRRRRRARASRGVGTTRGRSTAPTRRHPRRGRRHRRRGAHGGPRDHSRQGRSDAGARRHPRPTDRVDAARGRRRQLLRRGARVARRGRTPVHGGARAVRDEAMVSRQRHPVAADGHPRAERRRRLSGGPQPDQRAARRVHLSDAGCLRCISGHGDATGRRHRQRPGRRRRRPPGARVRAGDGFAAVQAARSDDARLAGRQPGCLPRGGVPRRGRCLAPGRRARRRDRRRLRDVARRIRSQARVDLLVGHVHAGVRVVLRRRRPRSAVHLSLRCALRFRRAGRGGRRGWRHGVRCRVRCRTAAARAVPPSSRAQRPPARAAAGASTRNAASRPTRPSMPTDGRAPRYRTRTNDW